jgi:heptosyltransferase-2
MRPRKIVVRSPNWVGDAVMATPALRALRAAHPDATISLEAPSNLEPLYAGLDSFDSFLPAPAGTRTTLGHVRKLRRAAFDCAVVLSDSPRSALAAFAARIPRRIGYARDPLRRVLLTDRIPPPTDTRGRRTAIPMVDRYLAVTAELGCDARSRELELAVDAAAAKRVARRLAENGVSAATGYLVVAPGASFGTSKIWPAGHFAKACDGILRRYGLIPVLAPGPNESDDARRVADAAEERCVTLAAPVLDLAELKALIAGARLVISNDTGPRHIAVALGRPAIVLMGPTDPRHTASQLENQRVLREVPACSPCHLARCPVDHRCMTGVSPFRAIAAAGDLLE